MKIIIDQTNDNHIVWDCFRESYIRQTNMYIYECKVKLEIINYLPCIDKLIFTAYKLVQYDNRQEQSVLNEPLFTKEVGIGDLNDEILLKEFDKFAEEFMYVSFKSS